MKGKAIKERARRYSRRFDPCTKYSDWERSLVALGYEAGMKAGLRQARKESGE